jgi:hypothetical protein
MIAQKEEHNLTTFEVTSGIIPRASGYTNPWAVGFKNLSMPPVALVDLASN